MTKECITIAVDAMGGDNAPNATIAGINLFLSNLKSKNVKILVFGDKAKIKELAKPDTFFYDFCTIEDTKDVIGANWKVSEALRQGKDSSMWKAIQSVAEGKADAVVSAGNTGALMAVSRKVLKMLPNIERPAIVGTLPTKKDPVVMLDLGANSTCTPQNLVQFAIMGDAFSRAILDKVNPKVAILNIGSEEVKGNTVVQQASEILMRYKDKQVLNYEGYIEGNEIYDGKVDVVVTDGFSGNIALKILEGTAKYVVWSFKSAIAKSILAKIGLAFFIPVLLKLRKQTDSRRYNGAMLIGLNGISVKAHGSSDKVAIASSLDAAYKLVKSKVNSRIEEELKIPLSLT